MGGDEPLIPGDTGVIANCCRRWRLWIRPVVMCLYSAAIIIFLPLLIVTLLKSEHTLNYEGSIIGGLFVVLAVPISLWDITQHLVHYTKPHMQKYIVRILWMVPIYALNALLGLTFPAQAIYVDTCRECYEAYVIYNFMMFLLTFLKEEVHTQPERSADASDLESVRHVSHLFPFCCIKPWPIGSGLIHRCKHGILQYTVVRPLTTVISLICEVAGVYEEGKFKPNVAYPYIIAINNLSQFIAMYHLVFFYRAHREALKPMKPIGKFLCIKAVVFFSFFQGVIIAILVFTGVIKNWFPQDVETAPQGIQNFLICIEMFLAALAHHWSFSYRPYVDLAQEQQGCCLAFLHMWDVSDVRRDLREHIHVIGSSVRRGVVAGRPTFGFARSRLDRRSAKEEERRSLLNSCNQSSIIESGGSGSGRDYQTMSSTDSDHEGMHAGLGVLGSVPAQHLDFSAAAVSPNVTVRADVESPTRAVADFVHLDDDEEPKRPSLA